MPSKRDRQILFVMMGTGLVVCWLWLASTRAATMKAGAKMPQVAASEPRGFCVAPFTLKLTTASKGAVIRYTLDGTEPTLSNGDAYSAPLKISKTTLLRAAAFSDHERVSAINTLSYLFFDQILSQPKDPPGFPSGPRAWNRGPSVYEMDARVVDDPVYRDRMRDALRSLPVVSLVCDRQELFGPRGLYMHTTQRGDEWERACSAEMILPDGRTTFQIDCGLRIQGGSNRERSPKYSFRLVFRERYGAKKLHYAVFPDSPLKKFDTLVLRADYNNSWIHWDAAARPRAQRTRDAWLKDSHRAMGWVAAHNRYVHLFLHGLYWGVYDFTERPTRTSPRLTWAGHGKTMT